MIERLNLATRKAAGLNKKDARLLHVIPLKPLQMRPSRYNVPTLCGNQRGIDKITLFEKKLVVKHLELNGENKFVEKNSMSFKGSTEFLAEKLAEFFKTPTK